MKHRITTKHLLMWSLLLTTHAVYGQKIFVVNNFSDQYYGKVHIEQPSEVFSPGWVAVYDKKTNRQLIKVESDELTYSLHDGKVKANLLSLPYGEQSNILYMDVNFDGKKDFVLMDGQFSCYHGPSFQVYLATDKGFKHHIEFTRLAQEYCGMFEVDTANKQIRTMTKSGCCWHQYSEFEVVNNTPVAIKIVEEGLNPTGFLWDYVEQNKVNGKMVETSYSTFNTDEEESTFYSFEFNNGKKMRLLKSGGDHLNYIFTDKNDRVEKVYMNEFNYSLSTHELSFTTNRTTYKITATGIVVVTGSRPISMQAKTSTIKDSMDNSQMTKFKNITINQ